VKKKPHASKIDRKLQVKKETIVVLTDDSVKHVVGGKCSRIKSGCLPHTC
jgi:hypothetical protein